MNCSLPPKPPPTSGAMTRILDSGTPVPSARKIRTKCGTWVALHTVICSPVGSTTTERGSMNAGTSRCWRNWRSITTPFEAGVGDGGVDVRAGAGLGRVEDPGGADVAVQRRGGPGAAPSATAACHVQHDRQLVVVDVHQLGGVPGLAQRARRHDGDGLAGERDVVDGQGRVPRGLHVRGDRPRVGQAALLGVQVGAGVDGDDAGRRQRGARVDRGDRGVRERAAHDRPGAACRAA